jgi:NADH dehydrogenase/NADH:ubiquinone oxidoreductase subunit G
MSPDLAALSPDIIDDDLLDPYERLVTIEVLGKKVDVPEKNRLLRCFQFLSLNSISYGDFCWNGECTNCQVWYHQDGQSISDDKPGLACRVEVSEGMVITAMSPFIKLEGINK